MLAHLTDVASRRLPQNLFDCILLDEAQDYTSDELRILKQFTTRLFAVGDINQRIQSEDRDALLSLEEEGVSLTTLRYHYRNGLKICRVADGIQGLVDSAEGLEATSNYDDSAYPSTVSRFSGMALDEQISKAIEDIPAQAERMKAEMANLQKNIKLIEGSLGPDHLRLVVAGRYVERLLQNDRLVRYLDKNHGEILGEFRQIVAGLAQPASTTETRRSETE